MSTAIAETLENITVEKLFNQVMQLPRAKQLQLARLIEAQSATPAHAPHPQPVPMPDDKRERQWVKEHQHEYAGQWVALDGNRLIAASRDQMEVNAAVEADGAYLPLILRVPAPDDLPFMGI